MGPPLARTSVIQLTHANPSCVATQCRCDTSNSSGACSDYWYPAGPEMNTLLANIFTDATTEYANLQSASPSIDFTDSPCAGTPTTGVCGALTTGSNFLITAPVGQVGYYEIEFQQANTFWNCNFNFGTSTCGIEIRQGIAHMFDKSSFTSNQPTIAGIASPLDNAAPTTSAGGLPGPNPCGYDASFPEGTAGVSPCVVGGPGGTSFHLGPSGNGANGVKWLYAPGSPDLNAAAQHFVNAGVATGFNSATSLLTNPVSGTTPNFYISGDDQPRKDLGESLASQICYLFTGAYAQPCSPWLTTVNGPSSGFPGFPLGCRLPGLSTCSTNGALSWWMYTAAFIGPTFFDGSLYFDYNSRFVSGVSVQTPCDPNSVPTNSPNNYEYICNPNYDNLTRQMETAPCLTAAGDPALGSGSNLPTGPNNGICPGATHLSAISLGIQAEAAIGAAVLTLPIMQLTVQYGYLNDGWFGRVPNGSVSGLWNHFTWLNAWNPMPVQPGTIRQGFASTTSSVNPYTAGTQWDLYIVNNVYDSLFATNPLSPSQTFNWMTYSAVSQSNATVIASTGYNPPPGTLLTYHFTLRNDVFFQDGRPVTAYDVAFSYLSLVGSGAFQGALATTMSGITVLGPKTFDIGVSSLGVFTLPNLTSLSIVPGRYWTGAGSSAWDNTVSACAGSTSCPKVQYRLNHTNVVCSPNSPDATCASFPVSLQQIDPAKLSATYDPIINHILLGSGPWSCGTVTASGSGTCTSGVGQSPPPGGSYTLTRFGNGLAPASSTSGIYFRSSGDLALWIWSQENDVNPIAAISAISLCFGQPVSTTGPCVHWQHGIGASSTGIVGINQVSAVELRYNLNWVSPKEWATNPPLGIGAFPPVLYEGPVTLNPCSIDSVNGYDC
jgi:Bacterial extracellular solute-binding proteins, family 5 Middle